MDELSLVLLWIAPQILCPCRRAGEGGRSPLHLIITRGDLSPQGGREVCAAHADVGTPSAPLLLQYFARKRSHLKPRQRFAKTPRVPDLSLFAKFSSNLCSPQLSVGPFQAPIKRGGGKGLSGVLSLVFTWGSYFSTVAKWDELSYPPTA